VTLPSGRYEPRPSSMSRFTMTQQYHISNNQYGIGHPWS